MSDLELVMIDVGNAFINALSREKVCARAGPEFGEFEGCVIIIVKALYGLHSSGSAWHSHFSDTLRVWVSHPLKRTWICGTGTTQSPMVLTIMST